jgi:hypothetical protein
MQIRERQSLLPDQDCLFRSLGNSLKKRSELASFELIQCLDRPQKCGISLYFSLIAGKFPWERGSLQTPSSAIESFSVCDSARDGRNTRLRGGFRTACGRGERSEPRIRLICGSFYPRKPDSGPRRKTRRTTGIRRSRMSKRTSLVISGTGPGDQCDFVRNS